MHFKMQFRCNSKNIRKTDELIDNNIGDSAAKLHEYKITSTASLSNINIVSQTIKKSVEVPKER